MKFKLRPYQETAVERLVWSKTLEGNDLCVLPTGAGKSIVIAELAHRLDERLLILQPSKEILEQNMNKLSMYVDPEEISVYSASFGEKEIGYYTFATIGSIFRKPEKFKGFKTVIIDECHTVNPLGANTMYTKFFKGIGLPKVIGFTATPYRMATMYKRYPNGGLDSVTTIKLVNRMQGNFWNRIMYNVNNGDLVKEGYLSPLKYIKVPLVDHKKIPLNRSRSDFNLKAFEKMLAGDYSKERIMSAIFWSMDNHKSTLVFCSSVAQAESLQKVVKGSAVVSAKTKASDRSEMIQGFKDGDIPIVFNVGVLTTGFDHPELDCIILLRPTRSIALYYQMLGRGVRIAPGKEFCQVIDFTGTVDSVGRVETIKLEKRNAERTWKGKTFMATRWELITETGSWHNKELYSFNIK